MSEEMVLQEVQAAGSVAVYEPLRHKSIAEIQAEEEFRQSLVKVMSKGKHEDAAHYGSVPGIKHIVFKEGIQFIADAYHLGFGDPAIQKESSILKLPDGTEVEHFIITAKTPIFNRITGQIVRVGVGSCSTMETKYRYRGEERKCPVCGKETIIKGKSEYGGGWLCYKAKGGCGKKFPDNAPEIIEQPVGKIENLNPADVVDTVIAMAVKRSVGRDTLGLTGMSRFLRLPESEMDEGHVYEGSNEYEAEQNQRQSPKQTQTRKQPDPKEAEALHEKLMNRFGANPKEVENWVKTHTKGKFSDVRKLETESQLNKLIEVYKASENDFSLSREQVDDTPVEE